MARRHPARFRAPPRSEMAKAPRPLWLLESLHAAPIFPPANCLAPSALRTTNLRSTEIAKPTNQKIPFRLWGYGCAARYSQNYAPLRASQDEPEQRRMVAIEAQRAQQ